MCENIHVFQSNFQLLRPKEYVCKCIRKIFTKYIYFIVIIYTQGCIFAENLSSCDVLN